jgi:hypothetical protein
MYTDPYCNPRAYGLVIVADVSWDDEPYQFNMSVVWKREFDGQFFIDSDSGCSCPSPFENSSMETLVPMGTPGGSGALQAVTEHLADRIQDNPIGFTGLIEKMKAAGSW